MTYQEMHIIGTKGHVESDQRFRGFETTLVDEGYRIINPYFSMRIKIFLVIWN